MAPIFRLLAAAGIFTLSCAAANAQVELNGVQIGTDDEAALLRIHPKAVCTVLSANDRSCVVRAPFAGVAAAITYLVADSKVVGGSAFFRAEDFDHVLQFLTEKYSKPQTGGAVSDDQRASWSVDGVTIVAVRHVRGTPTAGSIVLYETPAGKALADRNADRAKAFQGLLEKLLPEAEGARLALMKALPGKPREFDLIVTKSIAELGQLIRSGAPPEQVKAKLAELESRIGPLRSFPNVELQGLLAAIALAQGNPEEQRYHQAFGQALIRALQSTGDGKTPATALKVVSIREEYIWLSTQRGRLKPKSQALATIDGRKYDVWTVATDTGEEKVYFDVSALPHLK